MRFQSALLGLCVLICSCTSSVDAGRHGIHRRQNNSPSPSPAPPISTTATISGSVTSAASSVITASTGQTSGISSVGQSSSSVSSSDHSSSQSDGHGSSSTDTQSSSTSQTSTSSIASPTSTVASNGTAISNLNALPIIPSVTPGLSVAGVILLLTGIAYTLVGIKNRRLHIFLSTAFLTSLSVTVLVVYVMNPPVSNAVQGAYVVAAVITGLVFGAASIIFTEVTEGLGCLFGGFCLGMWLLVLRPGGLVTSTSGRAILIVACCLSFFALSFTHYTRNYGLIAGTAFGGATVVVIGIDCFSRAGLKEFWLYIWNLNSDLFPINTNTYPHTRGIRVEIAAIIIIFLIGLTSQMKLWKVIKERREKRAAIQLEDEKNLDQEEASVGRRVERSTNRDRAQWEAVYGNKDRAQEYHADSGIGDDMDSVRKDGSQVELGEHAVHDDIELEEMEATRPQDGIISKRGSKDRDGIIVRVARDDEEHYPVEGNTTSDHYTAPMPTGTLTPKRTSMSGYRSAGANSKRSSFASPAPANIPLPFAIPKQQAEREDDETSLKTYAEAESDHGDVPPVPIRDSRRTSRQTSRQPSRRASRESTKRNSQTANRPVSSSSDVRLVTHEEDAMSVTATMDSLTDEGSSTPTETVSGLKGPVEKDSDKIVAPGLTAQSLRSLEGNKEEGLAPAESDAESIATTKAPKAKSVGNQKTATTAVSEVVEDAKDQDELTEAPRSTRSRAPSEASGKHSLHESLAAQFPDRLSKVVMTYRTNEWAKHLTSADRPELDEIEIAPLAVDEEPEAVAPVMVEELQQTPMTAIPPPAPRSISQMSAPSNLSPPLARSNSEMSTQQRPALSPYSSNHSIYNGPQRSLSQLSMPNGASPNFSQSSVHLSAQHSQQSVYGRSFRGSSTDLLNQPLIESPVEDSALSIRSTPQAVPTPSPQQTLMGKRESLLRNKFSAPSIHRLSSTPESMRSVTGTVVDSASTRESERGGMEDDNMSLAQHRDMIRRESLVGSPAGQSPYLPSRQGSIVSSRDLSLDSHQPKREAGPSQDRRELMLASWRESVRQDMASTVQPKIEVEARREQMLMQRRQSQANQQHQEQQRSRRSSLIDSRMRKGDMMEAHKEAIRKMQASVNANV